MRYVYLLALIILMLSTQVLSAQDGAAIYKERCASCHEAPAERVQLCMSSSAKKNSWAMESPSV